MADYIDVGEYSNLWLGLRKIDQRLGEVVDAINKLTEAINYQTDKYELLMRELSEEKGKK